MAEFNFVAKYHDHTFKIDKECIPVEEMTALAEGIKREDGTRDPQTALGVMTCVWEDPENRPGQNPDEMNKVTFTIAIPSWDDPSKVQAWEESMLKAEYESDPKGKLKELWDKTLEGFFQEFLPDPEIQGVRCSQCQEWHHREHEHTCPDVSEEQSE